MNAIEMKDVVFSYSRSDEQQNQIFDLPAVDGVSFSVKEGEFVALVGHNGSGKSTVAKLLNGLLQPRSGEVFVFGEPTSDPKKIFEIRKNLGVVFQNPDNQMVATIVEDDIAFGPENVGVPREEIVKRVDFALSAVGMEEFRESAAHRLSGGQKQRIAIAGVLALMPKVMVLDESTAMLDPKGRREVMAVIRDLNKKYGITVIHITHFMEEAAEADRIVVMAGGKLELDGTPREVFARFEELQRIGLDVPVAKKIQVLLGERGLELGDCIFHDELVRALEEKRVGRGSAQSTALSISERIADQGAFETGRTASKEAFKPKLAADPDVPAAIDVRHLTYRYNEKTPFEKRAVDDLSLRIAEGEYFGIIGHTGSGKSTLIQHFNALILPQSGEIRINGLDPKDKKTNLKLLRAGVGMVFQYPEYQLFAETVAADVAFGYKNFLGDKKDPADAEKTEQAVREAIELVGLGYEEFKNRSPFELSGGQKRRVAIAGTIVTKPKVLILDEPTAGLDPAGKREVLALIRHLKEKCCHTVVMISHDMDEVAANCSEVAVLKHGKVLFCEPPQTLFEKSAEIEALHLELPQTVALARELNAKGWKLGEEVFAADKLADEIFAELKGGEAC